MRVASSIIQNTLTESANLARELEATGIDCITTQENNHDCLLPLAAAVTTTERAELATGIALAFPRSPTTLAYAAWDLNVSSGGRFVLGIGSQVKGHNERRFSVPWSAPAPRIREYIEAMRAVWRTFEFGDPLNYQGEHYQLSLMPPNFRPPPSELRRVPITVAALGPGMLRLAGHHCDGVRLHPFNTRKYLENVVLPELHTGFSRGGVARENFEIAGGGFLATGPDEEAVVNALKWVRQRIAFYGSTRSYHGVLEQHDLKDLGLKLHDMSKRDQWTQMPNEISDDVVALFAAVGTWENIADAVGKRYGNLVDTLNDDSVLMPGQTRLPSEVIDAIRRTESPFKAFRTGWQD